MGAPFCNIPDSLDQPKAGSSNGVAILVEGKYQNPNDSISFSRDMERAKSTYERLGFTVLSAQSVKEYEQAFKKAEEIGKQNPNDALIVHYTGHGLIIKDRVAEDKREQERIAKNEEKFRNLRRGEEIELEPAGVTPLPTNNPDDTSVLIFNKEGVGKNDYGTEPDKAQWVHEADVTRPIFNAAQQGHFNHVISIWDTCGAAAVDNKQYRNSQKKNIEVNPEEVSRYRR